MNRFINNLFYMGLYKVLLWLFICSLYYMFIYAVISYLSDFLHFKYFYILNTINAFICLFLFIIGIYNYYIPKKDKRFSNGKGNKNKR